MFALFLKKEFSAIVEGLTFNLDLVLKFLTPDSSMMKVQGSVKGFIILINCPKIILHLFLLMNYLSLFFLLRKEDSQARRSTRKPTRAYRLPDFCEAGL